MCRECWAAYMREYRQVRPKRDIRAAYASGREDMRITVVRRFEELGEIQFNARAVADIVRQMLPD